MDITQQVSMHLEELRRTFVSELDALIIDLERLCLEMQEDSQADERSTPWDYGMDLDTPGCINYTFSCIDKS